MKVREILARKGSGIYTIRENASVFECVAE